MLNEIFEYPFLLKIFNSLLFDKEKINLFHVSKFIYEKKHKFTFEDEYFCDEKYKNEWFFNCLTNIRIKKIFEFPKFVTKLKFDDYCGDILKTHSGEVIKLPSTITHLTFGHHFNESIEGCDLNGITHLTFGNRFNKSIYDSIPYSVTHLTFGNCFNRPIYNCIPNSVTHLTFGDNFNHPIYDCIPNSVEYLTYGDNFDQFIQNHIPKNVKYLTFGRKFDCPIVNSIPNSVTHLKFGQLFSRNLDVLPDSITHLYLSSSYDKTISRFPRNLQFLEAGKEFISNFKHLINNNVIINYCF